MKKIKVIALLSTLLSSAAMASYTGGVGPYTKTLTGSGDLSAQLNKLLVEVSKREGGGTVKIPAGEFVLTDIKLQSNVNIQFDKDTVIKTYPIKKGKTNLVFSATQIENFKLYCGNCTKSADANDPDNYFTIDISTNAKTGKSSHGTNIRPFLFQAPKNFWLSDFYVKDDQSKFSALAITPITKVVKPDEGHLKFFQTVAVADGGVIKNGNTTGGQYGYGLIQMQAGHNIHFEDLHGTGGVTLRLESGAGLQYVGTTKDVGFGSYENITAKNINGTDCKAVLMMSPHGRIHGQVHVDGVRANSCGFGAILSKGFIDRELLDKNKNNPNPTLYKKGYFKGPVVIKNVHAVFGMNAQHKAKDFAYLPAHLQAQKSYKQYLKGPNAAEKGVVNGAPSIAPVGYHSIKDKGVEPILNMDGNKEGSGYWKADISNVTGEGFAQCIVDSGYTTYESMKGKGCK